MDAKISEEENTEESGEMAHKQSARCASPTT